MTVLGECFSKGSLGLSRQKDETGSSRAVYKSFQLCSSTGRLA
jgi:hypothetical protein